MNTIDVLNDTKKKHYSAYHEPWFWGVLAPLILVFGVSSVLLFFAISGRDDRVSGDYYKQGRMINNRFFAEDLARQLNVSGKISFNAASGYVALQLRGQSHPKEITLSISHPAKADLDYSITLPKTGSDLYEGKVTERLTGRRYLIISAQSSSQELSSEVVAAAGSDAVEAEIEGASYESAEIESPHWRIATEMNFDHSEPVAFSSGETTESATNTASDSNITTDKLVQ